MSKKEYEKVVDALTERAMLGAKSVLREQLQARLSKKALEKGEWFGNGLDLCATLTIEMRQVLGDALVELEKVKHQ